MTNTDIIQPARDILAKWRERAATGPWRTSAAAPRWVWSAEPYIEVADLASGADARLIVGTAGNPDLLDAIDRAFAETLDFEPGGRDMQAGWEAGVQHTAHLLAAAIIAANERMNA